MSVLLSTTGLPLLAGGLAFAVGSSAVETLYSLDAWKLTTAEDVNPADGDADEVSNANLATFERAGMFERTASRYRLIVNSTDASTSGTSFPRVEFLEPSATRPWDEESEDYIVCQLQGMLDGSTPVQNIQTVIAQGWSAAGEDDFQVTIQSGAASSTTGDVRIRYYPTQADAVASSNLQSITFASNVLSVDAAGVHDPIGLLVRRSPSRITLTLEVFGNGIGSAATNTVNWNTDTGGGTAWSRQSGDANWRWQRGNYLQSSSSSPVYTSTLDHLSGTLAAPRLSTMADGTASSFDRGSRTLTFDQGYDYQLDMVGRPRFIGLTVNSDSLDGTTGRHGATKNPVFQGDHGFDDRLFTKGGNGSSVSLYHVNARETFPATYAAGDSITFTESANPTGALGARQAHGNEYTIFVGDALVANAANRSWGEEVSGANAIRARQPSPVFDFPDLLDKLPGGSQSSISALNHTNPGVTIAEILTHMQVEYPLSSFTKVDSFDGGYEKGHPVGFSVSGDASSGYSDELGKTWDIASRHILDTSNSDADRITLLKWMIVHGESYFWPQYNDINNIGNNGGGHFSGQVIPAIWMLWAYHESDPTAGYDQILKDYGTPTQAVRDNREQFSRLTSTMITDMTTSHTSSLKPWTSRERSVTATTGSTVTFSWDENTGDPDSFRCPGWIIRRGANGIDYGTITDDTNQNGASTTPRTISVTTNGNTASLVGQTDVWIEPPYTPVVNQPVWNLQGYNGGDQSPQTLSKWPAYVTRYTVSGRSQNTYMPSQDSYGVAALGAIRPHYLVDTQNGSFSMVAELCACFGIEDEPIWRDIVDLMIYSEATNWPGSGISDFRSQALIFLNYLSAGDNRNLPNHFTANQTALFGSTRTNTANFLGYT